MGGAARVRVPATSANLGPGYDCLGLALDLADELSGELTGDALVVEVHGEGADSLPRDESHLVVRSMYAAFDAAGSSRPAGLRLVADNRIPHARGLGSSSAAIVGGLVLGRALLDDPGALDDQRLLELATGLEGHPDNVAPALLGGFVVSGQADGSDGSDVEVWATRVDVPAAGDLGLAAFVPPTPVSTEEARQLIPQTVPHAEAAANTARAALLVAALGSPRPHDHLLRATEDFLHQDAREPAMPESLALVRRLRASGVPAVVSGAGPTVLAFTADPTAVACPPGWAHHRLLLAEGARIL